MKALGNFYAKKMAARDRQPDIKNLRVLEDDKSLVAPAEEYEFACNLLTRQKNKERLALLSTQCMQEPNSYQEFKDRQERRQKKLRAAKEKLIVKKMRNDELIRVDSKNATQFDWHKLPSEMTSDDL